MGIATIVSYHVKNDGYINTLRSLVWVGDRLRWGSIRAIGEEIFAYINRNYKCTKKKGEIKRK